MATDAERKLEKQSVQWKAATRAVKQGLTFEEVYERVHRNDVSSLDFDFAALSNDEKEHLIMRATPLSTAMKGFAAQFGSSTAGDAEFALSKPVQACDDFLSHAWSTDRLNKWCALAFTYNFTASLVAWFVTHIAGACVCYALAPADRSTIGFEYRLQCFVTAVIVPIAAQAFVLVYGLPALSLGSEPSVFLDKVCINQNHIGLKTLGINGLETFLKYSKRMVLLYDVGTYKRLWCAFESAMFSRYADVTNFVLVPCSTSRFTILMTAMSHVLVITGILIAVVAVDARGWDPAEFLRAFESVDHFILWGNVLGVIMTPTYFVMAYLLRNRCREITSIERSLQNFRLEDTQCFDPNDRKLVEARIKEVWGETERFNEFVQQKLSKEMSGSIGAADLPTWSVNLGMCWAWIPLFTYMGLIQTANKFSFAQYMTTWVGSVTLMWPMAIMFWNFFAFKIYENFDKERPKLAVFLIGVWSIFNCLFGACVDREIIHVALTHPLGQCAALLAAYWGANVLATHYFLHVEKRAYKGQMTWAVWAVMAVYWSVFAFTFTTRPAAIGCEHWLCVWPHPPL